MPPVTPEVRATKRRCHNPLEERRASLSWAQRLKRVFNIDVATCDTCGGAVRVIACIEAPAVINKILTHLEQSASSATATQLPQSRAPPGGGLFD